MSNTPNRFQATELGPVDQNAFSKKKNGLKQQKKQMKNGHSTNRGTPATKKV
jgi:hypothetical protein